MLRLSRRGWNNVLIFATLFMILLFSTTNRMLLENGETPETQSILPEFSEIMAIDYGSHKIERIGRGWRIQPAIDISEQQLSTLTSNWQQAIGKPLSAELTQPYIITVWLAGQEQAAVFKLQAQGEDVLIQHQQQLFLVSQHTLSDFIPVEIQ